MKTNRKIWKWIATASLLACTAAQAATAADEYDPKMTTCDLRYNLDGWSFLYRTMKGHGRLTCSNGQRLDVEVEQWAGGITFGRSEIIGGKGKFTDVRDVSEMLGFYGQMGAHGGAAYSGDASVVTKGTISGALSGTGSGVDLGVTLGAFEIRKR